MRTFLPLMLLLAACGAQEPSHPPSGTSDTSPPDSALVDPDTDAGRGDTDLAPGDTDPQGGDTDVADAADTDVHGDTDSVAPDDTDSAIGGGDTDVGSVGDTDVAPDTDLPLTPGTFPPGVYRLTPRPIYALSFNLFADGTWMLWYNEGTLPAATTWGCYLQGTYTAGTDAQGDWHLTLVDAQSREARVHVTSGGQWIQDGQTWDLEACAPGWDICGPGLGAPWVWPTTPVDTCTATFLDVLATP